MPRTKSTVENVHVKELTAKQQEFLGHVSALLQMNLRAGLILIGISCTCPVCDLFRANAIHIQALTESGTRVKHIEVSK
jgi:hypothetical protein